MDLPEENPNPEEPALSEETFPEEPILPEGFTPIGDLSHLHACPPQKGTAHAGSTCGRRTGVQCWTDLARRAFPSFEFFLFAFLCGAILGAAYLLNAPALLLVGVLLAPLLTPWVGMMLAAVTGSWRFFFLTLGVLLVAGALVFLTGALAGLAGPSLGQFAILLMPGSMPNSGGRTCWSWRWGQPCWRSHSSAPSKNPSWRA